MDDTTNTPATGESTATSSTTASALSKVDAAAQEPIEGDAVVISVTFILQCLGCAGKLAAEMVVEDPENLAELPTDEVQCPTCTANNGGRRVVIPVAATAGTQVAALEELWEQQSPAQPPAADASQAPQG